MKRRSDVDEKAHVFGSLIREAPLSCEDTTNYGRSSGVTLGCIPIRLRVAIFEQFQSTSLFHRWLEPTCVLLCNAGFLRRPRLELQV